jgi:hypothetical protein
MLLLLLSSLVSVETTVGVPVTVDYGLPPGLEAGTLQSTDQWEVLSQDSGVVEVLPMDLGTISLPPLSAWTADGDTILLDPPSLEVLGTMPDTLYAVTVFPYPAPMDIPPGYPHDYLAELRFWLVWGGPPGFDWLLALVLGGAASVLAVLAIVLIRKRRRMPMEEEQPPPPGKRSAEALALLDGALFAEGRWQELYMNVDRLLRNTMAWRFGIVNRALTYGQVRRQLREDGDGSAFLEESAQLVEEIILQRYADWGSTRERAQRFIRMLATLMEKWS